MNNPRPTRNTPLVHVAYLRLLAATLQARGLDAAALLHQAGLGGPQAVQMRRLPASLNEVDALLRAAQRAGAGPTLGLEVGAALRVSSHGALGYAVVCSRDLRQALQTVQRHGSLRNGSLQFRLLDRGGGSARFELLERIDLGATRMFYVTTMFATLWQVIETVAGAAAHRVRVELPLPEAEWRAHIARVFDGAVRYAAPRLAFEADAALLDAPCPTADAAAHAAACLECEKEAAQPATASLARRVGELLDGLDGAWPTLDEAAAYFHLTPRTLMRRLQAEGTRFQALLDEVRSRRAHWYLLHTRQPVEQIAARLGYADTRNFSRSFRRWHGMTPGQLRRGEASRAGR